MQNTAIDKVRNIRIKHKESLTKLETIATWITEHVGTMGFFLLIFFWTIIWLGWNIFAPEALKFDPFPGFVLWLFISNMIQIFLMPLIMIGQNLDNKHADLRAESDFEINMKAEEEIREVLDRLEVMEKKILEILEKEK